MYFYGMVIRVHVCILYRHSQYMYVDKILLYRFISKVKSQNENQAKPPPIITLSSFCMQNYNAQSELFANECEEHI